MTWFKNNYTLLIILILLGVIAFQYFSKDGKDIEFDNQLVKLHRQNDSLMQCISKNYIEIQRLDSLSKTYELKIEQDKVELAKLKITSDKNKQKYNEEHNRIITLSNSDAAREFTEYFK